MKVRFSRNLKVKDVLQHSETDVEMAEKMSHYIEYWDLKDPYTGEDVPTPEAGTSDWYLQIGWDDFVELAGRWGEWRVKRFRSVKKTEDES